MSEWDDRFWELYDGLTELYPHKDPGWRQKKAYAQAVRELGQKPPGLKWMLIKLGWGLVKSGGDMGKDFKKGITLKKAVKTAALGAAVVFLASFDTPEEWLAAGLPSWSTQFLAVAIGAGITALRNWGKHGLGLRMP